MQANAPLILSEDQAEHEVLRLASFKDKFAIGVGSAFPPKVQIAFERMLENDLYRLIDISTVSGQPPNALFRIFRLTSAGVTRRNQLVLLLGEMRQA
jgi:hypothetical protein